METSDTENRSQSGDSSSQSNDNDAKMSEVVKFDKRFGRIAIKNKLLTIEQVKDALRKQAYIYKKSNYIMRIGDILVDSGALGEMYRDAILKRQNRLNDDVKKHKSFGDIAVEKGFITTEQLESALAFQSSAFKKTREVIFLGDYLLEKGMISEQQRDEIVQIRDKYRTNFETNVQKIKRKPEPPSEMVPIVNEQTDETEDSSPEEADEIEDSSDEPTEQSISDKKSESSMKESPESDEDEDEDEDEEEDEDEDEEEGEPLTDLNLKENLKISITEDGLEAFLQVKAILPIRTRLLDLKHYIKESGIVHGLVANKVLKEWIKNKKKRRRPLKIAEGTQPIPPKDSSIVYHFDTGPKKAGTEKKDGSIDFKNRGETLSVKKGTLLAEKIPAQEGKPGLEVTGKIIDVKKPRDVNIKTGKGVSRSPDNLYVFAALNGMPDLDNHTKINVHPVLVISGDVGMQTGHIMFDGVVLVKGEVCPGFQVKAEKLEANAIMNAEVKTTGDIIVKGGIVGAKIDARGSVHAKFLKATKIVSKNNVNIQKEIVDCALDVGGKCLCEKGKIVATQIAAAQGVKAAQIGSELSASCKIMVGISAKIQKKLHRLKNTLENCKKDEQADIRAEISRITARELSGIPDATADIIVPKEIIGAEIQTRGKIVAGNIKNAVIESLGHVIVQKEIVKTKIQSGGEINIQNGKIMTSNLIALNGITALEVGSELSAPCKLGFGLNESVQERLSVFNKSLEAKQREIEQSKSLFENYQSKFKQFEIDAQDISWIKQYTKNLSGPMRRNLDSLDNVPPQSRMVKIKEYMGSMDAKMKASDYAKEFRNLRQIQEYMEKYFGRHQKMMDQISTLEERIKSLKTEIKTLQSDIRAISATSTKNSAATIQIMKAIYSRTELRSANAEMKITQDFGPCKISELKGSGDSGARIVVQKTGAVPDSKPTPVQKSEPTDKTEKKKSKKKDDIKITVLGRVMASSGGLAPAGVPNVKVSIKGWIGKKETNTDTSGEFIIPLLKPGKYKLTVQTKSRPPLVQKLKLTDKKKVDLGDLLLK
ncbi:protein containing DUF342 [Candidatus Magnetomorum sp. HK-1]|nr:protein containing DUF342 [Candidatus Magnetomorum sp. HK-1]